MSKFTEGEWKAGYNPSVTGPTTPTPDPFCGGKDWTYRTINVGEETIAIVPAQTASHTIGQHSEPLKGSAEANANLIVAAVNACKKINPGNPLAAAEAHEDMYKALEELRNAREHHRSEVKGIMLSVKALSKARGE